MKKLIFFLLAIPVLGCAQYPYSTSYLSTEADTIRTETLTGHNTAKRIGRMHKNTVNSMVNIVGTPKVTLGTSSVDGTITNLDSRVVFSSDAPRTSAFFNIEQSVPVSSHTTALEGYVKLSNGFGTGNLAIGIDGEVEVASNFNTSTIRSVNSGGFFSSGSGVVDKWQLFYAQMGGLGSGTVNNGYGLYIDNFPSGVTNKWAIYNADLNAPSFFAGKVQIGTSTVDGSVLGLDTRVSTNSSSGAKAGMYLETTQTAATSSAIQSLDVFTKLSNTSGSINLGIGISVSPQITNASTSVTEVRGIDVGGFMSAAGHVNTWKAINVSIGGLSSGTITKTVGLYIDAFPTGSGSQYNIETVQTTATNLLRGYLMLPNLPSSSSGLVSGMVWYDPADSNRLKYVP